MVIDGNCVRISFDKIAHDSDITFKCVLGEITGKIVIDDAYFIGFPGGISNSWIFDILGIEKKNIMQILSLGESIGDWPETKDEKSFLKLLKGIAYFDEF